MAASTSPPRSWREIADDTQRVLQQQLFGDKALALYDALGAHAADASTGGVLFVAGISAAQLVQRALRISASTPVLPTLIGTAAVATSSVVALHFASLPREIYENVAAQQQREANAANHSFFAQLWSSSSSSPSSSSSTASTLVQSAQHALQRRFDSLHSDDAPMSVYVLMGVLCFSMLGGRMHALAPSNVANLGAFHLRKASLPATAEYATPLERSVTQAYGRLFGCHTCGAKRGVKYHADHMPPKLVAQQQNAHLLRRFVGLKASFRFYPQCEPCSNQQAHAVKHARTTLKLHLRSLRLYHAAGVCLVLLCTGVGIVGDRFSSSDQRLETTVEAATAVLLSPVDSVEDNEEALLDGLRKRERRLRAAFVEAQRRKADGDATAIRHEIEALVQCKAALKTSSKRLRS